ncbi:MAG: FecR family protein [Elusimicrobiota bacterium]
MPIFALALSLPLLAASAGAAEPAPARLLSSLGAVTIESAGQKRSGKAGAVLSSGDAVSTGAGATALLELGDSSKLKLGESSRIVLTLPGPGSRHTQAQLSFGSLFAKIAKRLPGAEFRVRTESSVAAVRGTEFFTAFGRKTRGRKDLWLCVKEGAVEVSTDASGKGVLVPEGKGILIEGERDISEPREFDWTKKLNWNMDPESGSLEDKTDLGAAYADLLDQDYR